MMPPETGVPTPKVRVLIADDAEVIVDTLAAILDLAGYDACAVFGGEAAFRLINLLKPDLMITDVTTPGMAGVQSSSACLTSFRCKILLFTGYADLHSLLRNQDTENLPFELLTSPIRAAELRDKFEKSLCSEHPPLLVPIDTGDDRIH